MVELESSDHGAVIITNVTDPHAFSTPYVEVVGVVNADYTVRLRNVVSFDGELDLDLYDRMITLASGKYRQLFM